MNALALWLPGAALVMLGVLLFATQQLDLTSTFVLLGIGAAIETLGVLLWVRQRRTSRSPR
jgi:general stress protein CsbA